MSVRNLSQIQFPFQLSMCEPAGALYRDAHFGDLFPGESRGELMSRKLSEAKEPSDAGTRSAGVYDAIRSQGVRTPLGMNLSDYSDGAANVNDGHHRLASAVDIDPGTEVPVTWSDRRGIQPPRVDSVGGKRYDFGSSAERALDQIGALLGA